jgi:cytoskeleton protein RodZ
LNYNIFPGTLIQHAKTYGRRTRTSFTDRVLAGAIETDHGRGIMGLKSAGSRIKIKDIEAVSHSGNPGIRDFAAGRGSTRSTRAANEEDGRADGVANPSTTGDHAHSAAIGGAAMRTEPIGQALRNARVSAGMELSDVAAHLRIRTNFLSALEGGRADELPGVTYAIGYVRTYAAFLELDPEDAVKRFKQEAAGLHARTQLSFPSPAPEGKVPGAGVMVAAAVLATLAYGGWYVLSERGVTLDDMVPAVPERLAELITSDPATAPAPTEALVDSGATAPAPVASSYAEANPDGNSSVDRRATAETQSPTATATVDPAPTDSGPVRSGPVGSPPAEVTPFETATASTASTEQPVPGSSQDVAPAPTTIASGRKTSQSTSSEDMPLVARAPIPPVSIDSAAPLSAPDSALTNEAPSAPRIAAAPAAGPSQGETSTPRPSSLVSSSEAAVPTAPEIPAAPDVASTPAAVPDTGVVVRASGDSWVQIKDSSGSTLFTRVLYDGDVYRVPNQKGLTLDTGNAGTLSILVDGTAIPALGGFGDVIRNISLDPASLQNRVASESAQAPAKVEETTPQPTQ